MTMKTKTVPAISEPRTFRKLATDPVDGYSATLFRVSPPIPLEDGTTTDYVITSWGLESILGDEDNFGVFATDKKGRVLDWEGIFSMGEGPEWTWALRRKAC